MNNSQFEKVYENIDPAKHKAFLDCYEKVRSERGQRRSIKKVSKVCSLFWEIEYSYSRPLPTKNRKDVLAKLFD